MSKTCIACGMPMVTHEDHANSDITKNYCCHCARPDGSMQSFEEKLVSMTNFIVNTQGLAEEVAKESARNMLVKLPAWSSMK